MGLNKKIRRQMKKMPKYKIQDEAYQIQNLAKAEAFGKDRDIQMAQDDIDQDVVDSIGQAKDITSSSSALLSALTNIQAGGMSAKRGLAEYEAGDLRRMKIQNLNAANQFMIDEKDKEFYQNEYAPWETELRRLQEQKANRRSTLNAVIGGVLSAGGSLLGAGALPTKSPASTSTLPVGTPQ
jgi:hypothetical protein